MIEPLPWRPVSQRMRQVEAARQARLALLRRRPRRTRTFELTEGGILLTAVRWR